MKSRRQNLYLKKNQERRLKAGHIWIYSNEVNVRQSPLSNFTRGELVNVISANQKNLGIAYINPHTLLCARLLTKDCSAIIDADFFAARIKAALHLREQYYSSSLSYRLIFSESDSLPGLIVDRFEDVLVAQINTAGMENLRSLISEALVSVIKPKGILWRCDSNIRDLEGLEKYVEVAYGEVPKEFLLKEHEATFFAPIWTGQKTGWFFDQSYNRLRLKTYIEFILKHNEARKLANNFRALDVFSYGGGFGIQAALAGASEVLIIDASKAAADIIEKNAALNGVQNKVKIVCEDAFIALKTLATSNETFNCIILDPPAFIKRNKDIVTGTEAYLRLHALAFELLAKGGILFTTSCSLHFARNALLDVIRKAAIKTKRNIRIIEQLHQAQDHPIHPAIEETNYLKGFVVADLQ